MRRPCCDKEGNNKGAWSREEDQKLVEYIRAHGEGSWRSIPKAAGLQRCGKSCRLRWINYLKPDIKRGNFDQDEEDLIIKLHALLGNRWSLIAGRLPGRTDNEVKNYWNSHIKKKLIRMGIDPSNHKLSQTTHSRPLNNSCRDQADESSGSLMEADACNIKLYESSCNNNNVATSCQRPSNNASCLEDESSSGWQNLNLDLTISFPSPRVTTFEEKGSGADLATNCREREIDCGGSPSTLPLFR